MTDQIRDSSPYEVLGTTPEASPEELRRAYRRAMRRAHPDTGGDTEEFLAVQRAWQLVGSPAARRVYDSAPAGAARSPSHSPASAPSADRVWTSGGVPGATRAPSRARSHGHPGGSSRERYLNLMREWAGRGEPIEDPYDPRLVATAPPEIRHALADAHAEEATARVLADLPSTFTIWHDVATGRGQEAWAQDATAAPTNPPKIDHVVLGPTGLFAVQSEDWGAPAAVQGRRLASSGLPRGARPMRELAQRARVARTWGVRLSGLLMVLDDDDLTTDLASLGTQRPAPRFVLRRGALAGWLATGLPGVAPLSTDEVFATRTAVQRAVRLV